MNGHGLAQTTPSGGAPLVVCFALTLFSGLLRPFGQKARELAERVRRREPPSDVSPEDAALPITLTPIELALIAELSLERAADHAAVARDAAERPETREASAQATMAWRERARILQLEARRRSGQPMVPQHAACATASAYTDLDRRRQMRRSHARRGGPDGSADSPAARDRRIGAERRRRDRRRPEPAAR